MDLTHMNSFTLEFTDKTGNNALSLKEFIMVLFVDTLVPVPIPKKADGHVSLH